MKITGSQVSQVSQVYLNKVQKTAPAEAAAPRKTDKVELSADAELISAAQQVIAGTPEIREDKVEALRKQIADGSYSVPAQEVADKMLTEMRLAKLTQK